MLSRPVGIALADVSGKGLKAAMHAVMTNGMLHTQVKMSHCASEVLSELNATLYPRMEPLMNTAMCFCLIDGTQKKLQYANAGLPYAMLRRGDDLLGLSSGGLSRQSRIETQSRIEIMELKLSGMPLGAVRDFPYEQKELDLQTGDLLVLFTDGITEAMDENGVMYQETGRLKKLVSQFEPSLGAKALMDAILADVQDFVGDAEQYDDMTLVVAKIRNG